MVSVKDKRKFLLYIIIVLAFGVPTIGGVATGIWGEMDIVQFVLENPSHLPFYIIYALVCIASIIGAYYYYSQEHDPDVTTDSLF